MATTFPGIRCATLAEARSMEGRVNAAKGWPRCGRLAGTLTFSHGRHASAAGGVPTCACTVATSPHASCPFATRSEQQPVALTTGETAYPVAAGDSAARAALTAGERARIVDIPQSERVP